jgi:hypothetical protein
MNSNNKTIGMVDVDENGVAIMSSQEYLKHPSSGDMNCRGLVHVDDEIFFPSFPFPVEYTNETIKCAIDIPLKKCKAFKCVEGTLIRVFYAKSKWYTCTTRKLNAFECKWAAQITTFGETFAKGMKYILASEVENPLDTSDKDYLEYIYETYFDKTKKYAFIMRSTQEERIVCKPYVFGEEFDEEDESPIALVGVFDENNTVDFNYELKIESMVFPKPEELDSEEFETVEKLSEYVFNDINWAEHQGVIAFYQNGRELKSWKIVPVEYAQRFEIRNNVPCLRFRYLQLRNFRRNHPAKMELFLIMYPEFDHEQMETSIYNLCLYLHDLYMKKYIQKTLTIPLSDDESKILAIIHGIYKQDTFVITTPEKINNILAFGSPTTLNHLLKERAFKEKKPINN